MHKHHKTYGYHNLAAHIREETGLEFSDNLAHKCCKLAGIKSKARKTYHPNKGEEHITFKNEIFTNWNAKRPLEIVVSDMTELSTKYFGKFEWTFFLDTYNNEIIASSLSRKKGDPKPYYDCLKTFIKKLRRKKNQSFCTPTKVRFTPQKLSLKLMNIVPVLSVLCQELRHQPIIPLLKQLMVGLKKNYILILDFIVRKIFRD